MTSVACMPDGMHFDHGNDQPLAKGRLCVRSLTRVITFITTTLFFLLVAVAPSSATVFLFHQTSASVPNLFVTSAISINGSFDDLPSVSSISHTIDFGNLLAFDIISPVGHFTLNDFTPACTDPGKCLYSFPLWSISPSGIYFNSAWNESDFFITGFDVNSTIRVNSDRPSAGECRWTGACVVTGNWVISTVPEPSTVILLAAGLAGLPLARRWQNSRSQRSSRLPD